MRLIVLMGVLFVMSRSYAGLNFNNYKTQYGEVFEQSVACDDGGKIIVFFLREEIKDESSVPKLTEGPECSLKVYAKGKEAMLRGGDVLYYREGYDFTIVNLGDKLGELDMEDGVYEEMIPFLRLLSSTIR